jgi:hypothetical protein
MLLEIGALHYNSFLTVGFKKASVTVYVVSDVLAQATLCTPHCLLVRYPGIENSHSREQAKPYRYTIGLYLP